MKKTLTYIGIITIIVATIVVFKKCNPEPQVITETKIDYEKIKDSIKNVLIQELEPVYIDTGSTKYIKGKTVIKWRDSLVFVKKPTNTSLKIRRFKSILNSNNASANLDIFSSGEVVHVDGTINYTQKNTTTTKTIIKQPTGLFLYGETSIKPALEKLEVGLDLVTKKNIFGVNIEYINGTPKPIYVNAKVGFKLFNKKK
ncbi:hypothetical protein [Algibacter sp. PT7-4]|uniref:hypothetical protein n=1 Tax=Algibacter ulvanivorans TaxID=3400999 RepID=UPI003AB06281